MSNLKHSWKKTALRRDKGTGDLMQIKKCQYCHCIRFSDNVCRRRGITYLGVPNCFKSKKRNAE